MFSSFKFTHSICFHEDDAIRTFLTVFPYSLPCIVSGLLFAISSVAVMIWLPRKLSKERLVCHDNLCRLMMIMHILNLNKLVSVPMNGPETRDNEQCGAQEEQCDKVDDEDRGHSIAAVGYMCA